MIQEAVEFKSIRHASRIWTVTTKQIWQLWPKIASKWLILALAYEFDTKRRQSVQLNSYNWRNFDYVTASKAGWRK